METFLFITGIIFTIISLYIRIKKLYIPFNYNLKSNVQDAKSNLDIMRKFQIVGPIFIILSILLILS